jgi:hypothetical protein
MAINYIPRSQIVENKKAQIGEWVYKKTGIPFLGKYHLIKGKPFAGATFDPKKPQQPLEKTIESRLFKILTTSGPNSPAYLMAIGNPGGLGTLAGVAAVGIPIIKGVFEEGDANNSGEIKIRVFIQKSNEEPKTIKEVIDNSAQHRLATQNDFYKIVKLDMSKDLNPQLEEAEKIIPGIRIFLGK